LLRLFSGALAFVYPTRYEGFGLPILEAMQCGCPVITSLDPAVTETSGGAAIHAGSVEEISQAMRAVASNPERRRELRERGLARASRFSWVQTAQATRRLYEEALTGARR
jgi:glycosyltransferase involved in cell wall biosynthesis